MAITKLSIAAASRHTGKSRNTIAKDIKEGRLSCELSPSGAKLIDVSEIARVYGDSFKSDFKESRDQPTRAVEPSYGDQTAQRLLEAQIVERERERRQLLDQIEQLQDFLKRSQEGHNRATLLLENRASVPTDLESVMERLEKRIAEQTREFEKRVAEVEGNARNRLVAEIKDRPWWDVLFR